MKTALTALAVCLGVTVTIAASQNPPPTQGTPPTQQQQAAADPKQDPKPAAPDVTLTGCLVQGSTPTVFVFDNAKIDPKSKTEKGVKYLVLVADEDLNLRTHLNHEVELVGKIDMKPALPVGQKPTEKDLSTFTAKQLTKVSDTCGVPAK